MNAATMHPHLQAADLAIEIADESCRVLIETRALQVGVVRGPQGGDTPLYDITQLDPHEAGPDEFHAGELADIQRAVRYLTLRQLVVQPAGQSNLITFRRAA